MCAPTEVAFHNSWISAEELKLIAKGYGKSYARRLLDNQHD
ncbi:MAG: hypothetical protein ACLQNV_02485 [Steroidobacteraceae bacterium]